MRRYAYLAALILALGLLATACGGGNSKETFSPAPGNSELVVGPNRIAVAVVNNKNEKFLGDPGNSVQLQFKDVEGTLIGKPENAMYVEALPGASGFWVVHHTFDAPGEAPALLTVTKGDNTEAIDVTFVVTATGKAPMIGASAPPTNNPTLTNQPNKKEITTDSKPNDAFYQMTVTQALEAHKPFVVVFATPAFCQSAFCGPVLNNVKAIQPEFAGKANFIHIEPYVLDPTGGLANGQLTATQSTVDWNIQTEPWIFVVNSEGKITDRFEGSASPEELRQALQADIG